MLARTLIFGQNVHPRMDDLSIFIDQSPVSMLWTFWRMGYTCHINIYHYIDVIMTTIASQVTSLTIVYSPDYSDVDKGKHQSSASLAFVWGIHRDRWIPRTKGQLRGKCFHLMTSSCHGGSVAISRFPCNTKIVYEGVRFLFFLSTILRRCPGT